MESADERALPDAALRFARAVAIADEAASALAGVGRLLKEADRLHGVGELHQDAWETAVTRQSQAEGNLADLREALLAIGSRLADAAAPSSKRLLWADQFVSAYGRLQANLAELNQIAASAFEAVRPAIIDQYLNYAPPASRWLDSWSRDGELARHSLQQLSEDRAVGADQLDVALARLRWELGWPQLRIAEVVGLSQPSIASRLARIEGLISADVATSKVAEQGESEHFRLLGKRVTTNGIGRTVTGEIHLDRGDVTLNVIVLLAATDMENRGRTTSERGVALELIPLLEQAGPHQFQLIREVRALALYARDRGVVAYYPAAPVAKAIRQRGGLPLDAFLRRLREAVRPVATLSDLVLVDGKGGDRSGS